MAKGILQKKIEICFLQSNQITCGVGVDRPLDKLDMAGHVEAEIGGGWLLQ